jgi:hypothetical protein
MPQHEFFKVPNEKLWFVPKWSRYSINNKGKVLHYENIKFKIKRIFIYYVVVFSNTNAIQILKNTA